VRREENVSEHPIVRVVPDLDHRWEIQVNPDGSRTLLVRDGLPLTDGAVDMINDIHRDRDRCTALAAAASSAHGYRWWRESVPSRAHTITKLINAIGASDDHIPCPVSASHSDELLDDLIQPRTPPDE